MTSASVEGKTPIIVTGDDEFDDYNLLKKEMKRLTFPFDDVVIYTRGKKGWSYEYGRPTGPEFLIERWVTKRLGLLCVVHPDPKIKRSKREDAQLEELLGSANRIIVFWNGYDSNTEQIIQQAKWKDMKVKVIRYE
jgi:hypothetical protein